MIQFTLEASQIKQTMRFPIPCAYRCLWETKFGKINFLDTKLSVWLVLIILPVLAFFGVEFGNRVKLFCKDIFVSGEHLCIGGGDN